MYAINTYTVFAYIPNSRKSSTDDQIAATQCLHIAYHPAIRHWLLMVFPDHVDIVDIEVSMVIGAIRLDQNASAFVKVGSLW